MVKIIGIYKITCLTTNKIYVGQSTDINTRFKHYRLKECKEQKLLYRSLEKYGVENHRMEIIEEMDVSTSNLSSILNEKELYWTKELKASSEDGGLVLRIGGEHGFMTEEVKIKMSKSKVNSPYNKAHIRTNKTIQKHANNVTQIKEPILCYSLDGELLGEYESASKIVHELLKPKGLKTTTGDIFANCRGKQLKCKGYIFQFKNNDQITNILTRINKDPLRNNTNRIYQYTKNNEYIRSYSSSYDVVKIIEGVNSADIRACCKGKQKTAHGFVWLYNPPYLNNGNNELEKFLIWKNYGFRDIIIPKNWFLSKTTDELKKYVKPLTQFLFDIQREFPFDKLRLHPYGYDKVKNTDINKIINDTSISNRGYVDGNMFLKARFPSYWKSTYSNKTPIDYWNDEKAIEKIIEYRIGVNKIRETFDFSLNEIIKGISAIRGTISFFKPQVAFSIYKHFLGDVKQPTVLDPCSGFGGRLLGFKEAYPDGTYIGVEPNPETYNELKELVKELNYTKVYLYNCKIEDYPNNISYNLAFTSIPYYNKEKYSVDTVGNDYEDMDDWVDKFIDNGLLKLDNLVVNIPQDLEKYFLGNYSKRYTFTNAISKHLNKSSSSKDELVLVI